MKKPKSSLPVTPQQEKNSRADFHRDGREIVPPKQDAPPGKGRLRDFFIPFIPRMRYPAGKWQMLLDILALMLGAQESKEFRRRVLAACVTCGIAIMLNAAFLSPHTFNHYWEPLSKKFGEPLLIIPMAITALFSGLLIGAIQALVFRKHAVRLAACIAILILVFTGMTVLLASPLSSHPEQTWRITSVLMIPLGIILGAITTNVFHW